MSRKRKGRAISGVLLLDKPDKMTSNRALQICRRLFNAQKAGHTGSLDPLATGVLPVCFGEATKFSGYLLNADKGYLATAKLGVVTDTGDSDGAILSTHPVPELSAEALEVTLETFRGAIEQVPSMYSALKHQGRPLYEFARQGINIERPPRPVRIFQLEMLGRTRDTIDLKVLCSKGTYIRTLVEDIGKQLGCGAHVTHLRRFQAGHFDLDDAVVLDDLQSLGGAPEEPDAAVDYGALDRLLLPIDRLLPDFPKICVNVELARSLLHGQAVRMLHCFKSGMRRCYASVRDGEIFIGLVEVSEGDSVQPRRMVNVDLP